MIQPEASTCLAPHPEVVDELPQGVVGAVADDGGEELREEAGLEGVSLALLGALRVLALLL